MQMQQTQRFPELDVTTVNEGKLTLSMSSFTKKMTDTLQIKKWKGDIATPGRADMKILTKDDKSRTTAAVPKSAVSTG